MHPLYDYLTTKVVSIQAGLGGEERVADVFHKHSFAHQHRIFHDLQLTSIGKFQIDTLFLTRAYALILEVKNIAGSLRFEENPPQLLRTINGKMDGFDSPAAQVERYRMFLQAWLHNHGIHIPIYGAVVLAYPKQIVEKAPHHTKILFPNLIPQYIHTLSQQPSQLETEQLDRLSMELLSRHQDFIPAPICETYDIVKDDIIKGVICQECNYVGMKKLPRTWFCPGCNSYDAAAHEHAIKDWFILFGGKMTNRDCRDFLQLKNAQASTRILRSMQMQSEGSFRNRSYFLDN